MRNVEERVPGIRSLSFSSLLQPPSPLPLRPFRPGPRTGEGRACAGKWGQEEGAETEVSQPQLENTIRLSPA